MTFNITVVLAFVGRGGRWHFDPAVRGGVTKSLKTTDIEYVKGDSIPHVDALSRLRFYKESKDKTEEFEDTFLHWVETDVLSLDRKAGKTRHDPVGLSRITSRRKNIWRNCSRAERLYKEIRHKLTIGHGVICNGDLIIPSETQRKLVIKSVHDDIHCGVPATQKG